MDNTKFWQRHPKNKTYHRRWLIRAVTATLTCLLILAIGVTSYAEDPSAAIIIRFTGNGLNLRRGTNRNVTPVRAGQRNILENSNDVLYVPGDNNSRVRFAFAVGQIWEYGGLRVQTEPSTTPSEYRFPCRGRGNFTIGWRPQGETQDRACKEGVALGRRRRNRNSQVPLSNPWDLVQAAKNIFKAQTEDDEEVLVVPSPRRVSIQTTNTGDDILVDVAEGDVLVKSDKNPAGKPVRAGERYSYLQDRVTPIDRNALLNSPSMQEFLNPNNWSSPDVPQRVADEIAREVEGDRTALGLSSSSVASNPRNNSSNIPSQQPTGENDIVSTGNLELEMGLFKISSSSCEVVPDSSSKYQISFTERNNQFTFSAPPMVPMTTGTSTNIRENLFTFEASGPSPIKWSGTFYGDGNYLDITGVATCGTASQPFKLEGFFDSK